MNDLVERLSNQLPLVGESEDLWCVVHTSELREAIAELTALRAQVEALREDAQGAHLECPKCGWTAPTP